MSSPPTSRIDTRSSPRALIVNADDFGQSSGINEGIARAHEHGIVTSASLMVNWHASADAAEYARAHPHLSIGLHVDFGEWAYRGDEWVPVYQVISDMSPDAIARELNRQLALFYELVGHGPTHLDSHQHAHRDEPLRSILRDLARTLAVPLRQITRRVRYCGGFYGQTAEGAPFPVGISKANMLRILRTLRPGITELGCHPGRRADVNSMYTVERVEELRILCDAQVRAAIQTSEIHLGNFSTLLPGRRPHVRHTDALPSLYTPGGALRVAGAEG